jgi:hypothetical protein
MKNVSEPRRLGESVTLDPWFWTVGRPNGMIKEQETDWSREGMFIPLITCSRTFIRYRGGSSEMVP